MEARKKDRFRLKPSDFKGVVGGFKGRMDTALEKIGAIKSTKLDFLLQQTLSGLAILKNQRRLRCAHGKTDIAELLQNGHQDLALLRAEYVLNEQNMLEVFDFVQNYCNQLIEKLPLLKHQKKCPLELKETIDSLIFVSSKCEEIPELDDVRSAISYRFGAEFVTCAVELQTDNSVNTILVEKLSKQEPSTESKSKIVREIALDKRIEVSLEEAERLSEIVQVAKIFITNLNMNQATPPNSAVNSANSSPNLSEDDFPPPVENEYVLPRTEATVEKEKENDSPKTKTTVVKEDSEIKVEKCISSEIEPEIKIPEDNDKFSYYESHTRSDISEQEIIPKTKPKPKDKKSSLDFDFSKLRVCGKVEYDDDDKLSDGGKAMKKKKKKKWPGSGFHRKRKCPVPTDEDSASKHGELVRISSSSYLRMQ